MESWKAFWGSGYEWEWYSKPGPGHLARVNIEADKETASTGRELNIQLRVKYIAKVNLYSLLSVQFQTLYIATAELSLPPPSPEQATEGEHPVSYLNGSRNPVLKLTALALFPACVQLQLE